MTDLQPKLGEVRKLAEAKTIDSCGYLGNFRERCSCFESDCPCHYLGFKEVHGIVPDPAHAPLLEVVRQRQVGVYTHENCYLGSYPDWTQCPPGCIVAYRYPEAKSDCKGTGFVTRSLEDLPRGALRGAIEFAIIDIPNLWAKYAMAVPRKHWKLWSNEELLDVLVEILKMSW